MDNVTATHTTSPHSSTAHTVVTATAPVGAHMPTKLADLATRHQHGVSRLLAARGDLRGVHAFADVVEESVRWSA